MPIKKKFCLDHVREKVTAGERLSAEEVEMLWDDSVDLHELGDLANVVRERKNGNSAFFNINTHLNPTNVCVCGQFDSANNSCAWQHGLRKAQHL